MFWWRTILNCAMSHYETLWTTMTYYESLWPKTYSLWPTLTNHKPFWATMVHHLIYFILPHNRVGYLSTFLFCETSRYFILNKIWFKKVFKSAYSELDNCLLKLFPQITFLWWIGFQHFKVPCWRWNLYMQVFRDANSKFNIFLHSVQNIFFRVNLITNFKSTLS